MGWGTGEEGQMTQLYSFPSEIGVHELVILLDE
jgi:hypothetical protein